MYLATQMIKIYFPYIGNHSWLLAHSSQNPWNFLSAESDKDDLQKAPEDGGQWSVEPAL